MQRLRLLQLILCRSTKPLLPTVPSLSFRASVPSRKFTVFTPRLASAANPTPKAAGTDAQAAAVANMTGVTPEGLEKTLQEKLEAQHVEIEDMSGGCGQMYQAIIVSPQFVKKNTLARHRLVNSVLKSEIAAIHAWTPKCFTPDEWEKAKSG